MRGRAVEKLDRLWKEEIGICLDECILRQIVHSIRCRRKSG